MTPFAYPARPLQRRHQPRGYSQAESFRPWLRDDFAFRCVYCLKRERWENRGGSFAADHVLPVVRFPHLQLNYDNLVYACVSCNTSKGAQEIPNPVSTLIGDAVGVHADGSLEGRNEAARLLIDLLMLDSQEYRRFRLRWMQVVELAAAHSRILYEELPGYPPDLPDLSRLEPPDGNGRPEGVLESCHARKSRGELPQTY